MATACNVDVEKVRQAMIDMALNRNSLARMTGLAYTTVISILQTGKCSSRTLRKLAKALQLPPRNIMLMDPKVKDSKAENTKPEEQENAQAIEQEAAQNAERENARAGLDSLKSIQSAAFGATTLAECIRIYERSFLTGGQFTEAQLAAAYALGLSGLYALQIMGESKDGPPDAGEEKDEKEQI